MTVNYPKDLHAILGVTDQADSEELRKAYLALAVKYHPDRNHGHPAAEERFKDISQAYAILNDPVARARYESLRPKKKPAPRKSSGPGQAKPQGAAQGKSQSGSGPGSSSSPHSQDASSSSAKNEPPPSGARSGKTDKDQGAGAGFGPGTDFGGDFDDVLNNFFQSAKGRETLKDLEEELNKAGVEFQAEDLASWLKEKHKKPGQKPSQKLRKNPHKKPLLARFIGWLLRTTEKLPPTTDIHYQISLSVEAAATGTEVDISYQDHQQTTRHLKVKIPAKTSDGAKLRLSGQGHPSPKADEKPGDLILTITVGGQTVSDLWGNSKK